MRLRGCHAGHVATEAHICGVLVVRIEQHAAHVAVGDRIAGIEIDERIGTGRGVEQSTIVEADQAVVVILR